MNNLTVIKDVECYIDQDGIVQLRLEHVAKGLGFTTVATSGNECVRWERVGKYLNEFNFHCEGVMNTEIFIPEPIFYLLAMKANNKVAKEFQRIVAYEILPEIRKTGMYSVQGLSKELQAIFITDKKVQEVENRVNKLENTMTIDYGQQEQLREIANKVVVAALGGKSAPAYKKLSNKAFSELWNVYKREMQVNSYRNTAAKDFETGKLKIQFWKPSEDLALMIKGANVGLQQ